MIPDRTWPAGSWVEYDNEQWPGWGNDGWFENCHIARYAVLDGDAVVIQSQTDTKNLPAFKTLVNDAKADAARANSAAFVDAELSDGYGTPAQAFAAGSSVKVSGYFINCGNSTVSWENSLLNEFKNNGY